MLMSKLRPRRFTSRRIFKVSKVGSNRNQIRRAVAKLICVYLSTDNSSSMRSQMTELIAKEIEAFKQLTERIEKLQRKKLKEFEAVLEMNMKKYSKKRPARCKRMKHFTISIDQKKTIEKVFRNKMQDMRNQIQILLFGERYAPWHRISPPNRSESCWRSTVVTG